MVGICVIRDHDLHRRTGDVIVITWSLEDEVFEPFSCGVAELRLSSLGAVFDAESVVRPEYGRHVLVGCAAGRGERDVLFEMARVPVAFIFDGDWADSDVVVVAVVADEIEK